MSQPIQPGQQQAPGASAYPQYPAYPYYGYYPWYPPQPVTLPPTPAERPARPGGASATNVIVLAVATLATIGALALAAIAPSLAPQAPAPTSGGLTQVYNMSLADDPTNWSVGNGCTFEQGGLHARMASDATLCAFVPSTTGDLTRQGFYLTATVAPANKVMGQEEPCIELGGNNADIAPYTLAFDQAGNFILASQATPCDLSTASTSSLETDAWHADGFTPNQIGLRYAGATQTLSVYVNGQQVLSTSADLSSEQQISLGASGGGEAIFTDFALYSANAPAA